MGVKVSVLSKTREQLSVSVLSKLAYLLIGEGCREPLSFWEEFRKEAVWIKKDPCAEDNPKKHQL